MGRKAPQHEMCHWINPLLGRNQGGMMVMMVVVVAIKLGSRNM